jgi:hypothetical protein
MFVSNGFIWWEKFILGFFTLKVHEKKTSKIGLIFGFGLILVFRISFWFFEAIDKFITISKVFWVEKRVLGQKYLSLDSLATTVSGI